MAFPIAAGLLDAVVLAVVARKGTYGYKITQDVRQVMDISESTLYPVLRRLQGRQLIHLRPVHCRAHPALLPDYTRRAGKARGVPCRLDCLPRFD